MQKITYNFYNTIYPDEEVIEYIWNNNSLTVFVSNPKPNIKYQALLNFEMRNVLTNEKIRNTYILMLKIEVSMYHLK